MAGACERRQWRNALALIIRGKSICPICGRVLNESDALLATPAFLKSTHRLARFSDAAFHQECFLASPEHEEVERLWERYRAIWARAPSTLEEGEIWVKEAFLEFD